MGLRRSLPPQSFGNQHKGKPAVILGINEWLRQFRRSRTGTTGQIERYATEPEQDNWDSY